jgi:hypothetical protein
VCRQAIYEKGSILFLFLSSVPALIRKQYVSLALMASHRPLYQRCSSLIHSLTHSLTHSLFTAHTLTRTRTRCHLPPLSLAHSLTRYPLPALIDALDTDFSTVEVNMFTGVVSTPPLISYEKILDPSKTSTSHTT